MKFSIESKNLVLRKGEVKTSDSGDRGHLMLMNSEDCGSVYVPLDIFNSVEESKEYFFSGIYQSFDGKNYISWKSVRPCKG